MTRTAILAGLAALAVAGVAQAQDQPPALATPSARDALAQAQAENAALRQQLEQAQSALQALQAQDRQLQAQVSATASTLQACNAKNVELVKLSYEILDRYKREGLGAVLARKEPFTGLKRVQVQNLAQDYEDRLRAGTYDYRRDKAAPVPASAVTEPSSH